MKKKARIHHHAANKIRQLFSRRDRGAQPRDSEQSDAKGDPQQAEIPLARNEPTGQGSHGGNGTNTANDQQSRNGETGEAKLRGWLLVIFTGIIVFGTWYYACTAKKQADTMIEQRDVMIQQVNASQKQVEEAQKQTNTFTETLTEARRNANAAVDTAKASEDAAATAQDTLENARARFKNEERPYVWLTNDTGKPQCVTLPDTPDAPNCNVFWSWHVINYGKTPAHDVEYSHTLIVGNEVVNKPRVFGKWHKSVPMPPGQENFATGVWVPRITPKRFAEFMDTENSIMLYGRIRYRDAYGGRYETGFCLVHLRSDASAFCKGKDANYIK